MKWTAIIRDTGGTGNVLGGIKFEPFGMSPKVTAGGGDIFYESSANGAAVSKSGEFKVPGGKPGDKLMLRSKVQAGRCYVVCDEVYEMEAAGKSRPMPVLSGSVDRSGGIAGASSSTSRHPGKAAGWYNRKLVILNYPRAQRAAVEVNQDQSAVQTLVADCSRQYTNAKNSGSSPAELAALQKKLQALIDARVLMAQQRANQLEASLQNSINQAVEAESKARGVSSVSTDSQAVAGAEDLTEGIGRRLREESN